MMPAENWMFSDNVSPIPVPNTFSADAAPVDLNMHGPQPTDIPVDTLDTTAVPTPKEVPLDGLLLKLTPDQQAELVAIIKEDYRNAIEARTKKTWGKKSGDGMGVDFDEKYADLIDLYEGADERRPEPWMCARSLKIAQAIVEMAVAKLLPMVYNEDTIKWKPVRYTNRQYTQLVNRMMFWVITTWMKGRKDAQLYTRNAVMLGSVFAEAWWKITKKDMGKTQQVPVVGPDGQPMMNGQGQPVTVEERLMDVDERPQMRIIPVGKVLLQPGATTIEDDSVIIIEDHTYRELEGWQKEGLAENVTDELKSEIDTRIVTEFALSMEKAEDVADFNAKRRNMPIECLRWFGKFDANGDGFDEEIVALISNKDEVYVRSHLLAKISRTGERTIRHTNFLDRIGGKMLGMGLLEQVKPLAEEIDACFRQMTDANTMSVMRWGFYDPNSDYDPDEHVAKPRAMYPVSNPQQNVYFPDIQIPIERLLNAIKLVTEFIERLTAASSYQMGKESEVVGGSGTATRTQAIMSSADTRFNLPATNLRIGLAQLYTDVFNLCSMNMPEGLEEKILGAQNEKVFSDDVSMQDALALEMECYLAPAADLGDSNTRRQLASMLYDKLLVAGNPLIVNDPNRIWFTTANYLTAYGEDPIEWIGKPASQKPTNDPMEEHTMMRDGRYTPVESQENHMEHIQVHTEELQGPNILLWPPQRVEMLRQHIQQHMQMMQQMMVAAQSMGGKKGGAPQGEEDDSGEEPGADSAQKGGAAIVGGQPDTSVAPNQASGTAQQQASGAAGGGV
jgi:hypothetical protein